MTITDKVRNTDTVAQIEKKSVKAETNIPVKEDIQGTSTSTDGVKVNSSTLKSGRVPSGTVVFTDPAKEKEFQTTTKVVKYAAGGIAGISAAIGGVDIISGLASQSTAKTLLNKSFTSTAVFNGTSEMLAFESRLATLNGSLSIAKGGVVICAGLAIAGVAYGAAWLREYNHEQEKAKSKP